MKEKSEEKICVTKKIMSSSMAVSTVGTVYGLVGYCAEKFPTYGDEYNKCVANGIPVMVSGMVKHGLATEQEVDDAKKAGMQGGYRLFTEGTGWLENK